MADQTKSDGKKDLARGETAELQDYHPEVKTDEVCCGGPPPPKSTPFERPGYILQPYVRGFIGDDRKDVALVKTKLERQDHYGTLLARLGWKRDEYKVSPGLYGVGHPAVDSPVIVTANYKLTFDSVRKELDGENCWLLVLDTCGVNVWCAAGKQTFSTAEIIRSIEETQLAAKVSHRKLIVPQLGATGVAAHEVKLKSGFRVIYGPVRACDIKQFIANGFTADEQMRAVTFTIKERFVLIPVEFYLFGKKIWWIFPLLFLLSGVGETFFSPGQAWQRGGMINLAVLVGGCAGAVMVPLFLPWIPGRSFSFKGMITGIICGGGFLGLYNWMDSIDSFSIFLVIVSISSYLAMNFTGSTPYTSPSGVEKEMKLAIPFQAGALFIGGLLWLAAPFV